MLFNYILFLNYVGKNYEKHLISKFFSFTVEKCVIFILCHFVINCIKLKIENNLILCLLKVAIGKNIIGIKIGLNYQI